ncbi:MAG: hypothetical protein ABMA01_20615 [Chthoniobacteraceae bacterium]
MKICALRQIEDAFFLRSFSTVSRENRGFPRKAPKIAIARKPSIHQPSKANAKWRETVKMAVPEL